jgi:ATP-dependent Clp protease adaptor protein ClpS
METVKKPETNLKMQKPKNYLAVILNDDYTSFEAVEFILQKIFHKNGEDAQVIANEVHKNGKGIAGGPYTFEVCETKVYMAMDIAKQNEMPLRLTIEEA